MSAAWDVIFYDMWHGSLAVVVSLLKVLIPLMVVVELLMVYKVIEKLARRLRWFSKALGISDKGVFPLLVGILMGVTYGAGTIMEINKKTPLSQKDMALVSIFMYLCHGIIEVGFLFYVAGANVILMTILRFLFAFLATAAAARLPAFRKLAE